MKNKWRNVSALAVFVALFILIIDTKTAILGAKAGITQCITVIIPSLFPFFIVCSVFCQCMQHQDLGYLSPLCRICKIPKGAEPLLLISFLGGYPIGAREITAAYEEGKLNRSDAERMLGFCNNAGPSFIFGILALQFSNRSVGILLLLIQILSAILTAVILPGRPSESISITTKTRDFIDAFNGSIRAIIAVCGWIVLFRVVISFLQQWILWALPDSASITISGILELATGCTQLHRIENDGVRMILGSALLSLGGICVYLQTRSVTNSLSLDMYFPGKLIQCCIAIILSGIIQFCIFIPARRISIIYLIIPLVVIIGIYIVSFKIELKKRVAIGA